MASRSLANFVRIPKFDKALNAFGKLNAQLVADHISRFQSAWCESIADGDLPARFHFEHYKKVRAPYRLCQIRVGPNNNYRAVVMFPNGRLDGYWIYVFKKEGQREPREMEHAKSLAEDFWHTIKGDDNGKR